MRAPSGLRPLVAESWQRSARVDPDGLPEVALGDDELDALRRAGPLGTALPVVRRLLLDDARAAGCIVAVTDAAGRLVWVDGAHRARSAAEGMGFVREPTGPRTTRARARRGPRSGSVAPCRSTPRSTTRRP